MGLQGNGQKMPDQLDVEMESAGLLLLSECLQDAGTRQRMSGVAKDCEVGADDGFEV